MTLPIATESKMSPSFTLPAKARGMVLAPVLLAATLAVAPPTAAQEMPDLRFGHLTMDDGLSNTWVHAVLRDRRGFLWVGTQGGLDRYDGERVVNYGERVSGPHGVGGIIRGLFEDPSGRLWVAAPSGLFLYDVGLDRFDVVALGEGVAANSAERMAADVSGRIWVATGGGLAVLEPQTGAVQRLESRPRDEGSLQSNAVNVVAADGKGRIWYGLASGGLGIVDPDTMRVTRLPLAADLPRLARSFGVQDIHTDRTGRVWVASYTEGLIQFDPESGRVVAQYVPEPGQAGSIGSRRVKAIVSDEEGRFLYAGTENDGLEVLDIARGRFHRFMPRRGDDSSLGSASVYGLFLDRQRILWIGTYNGGVDFTSPVTRRFRSILSIREDELADPHVAAILEDDRGDLWVGTDGGGIDRFERDSGRVIRYRHDPRNAHSIGSDAMLALIQDRSGSIWAAGWDSDLMLLDRESPRVVRRIPLPAGARNVLSLRDDAVEGLLLCTQQGLVAVDSRTGTVSRLADRYPDSPDFPSFASTTLRDSRGRLWMGLAGGAGILEAGGRIRTLRHDPSDPHGLGSGAVDSLAEDSRGNVWLGIQGGLVLVRPTGETRRYGVADGLPSNTSRGTLEDSDGNLWVSTDRGLVRIEAGSVGTDALRLMTFTLADGLPATEFKQRTAFRSRSGEMFFGTQKGLARFFPKDIVRNPEPPPVAFTGLRLANHLVAPGEVGSPLDRAIGETALTFAHNQNVLTFEFAALDLLAPSKNRYRYRLEGFETEWNDASGRGSASYAGLPPGTYTLRVKASNNDGVWNEEGATLALRIRPPWWRHWLFYALLVAALVAGLAYGYRWRVRRLEARGRELARLVDEAVANVKQLRGLLPICSACKKIRDDEGYWELLEIFVEEHSDAQFSHGLCPDCIGQFFPSRASSVHRSRT